VLDAARLGFEGFVDLVRDRMAAADARFPKRAHRFRRDLVPDVENVPESWYRGAFDDLARRGELTQAADAGGDVSARLSAVGHSHWRMLQDDAA
jgi:hypothetical protein